MTTEPESGRIVADFPETSNITLVCRVRTEDGSARGTSWFTQTAQDREDGRQFQQVLPNDLDFFISGVIVETPAGSFIDHSILIIASLTSDLDTAIIFCGFDRPLANLTFRLYCKNIADILSFYKYCFTDPPVLLEAGEIFSYQGLSCWQETP